MPTVGTWHLKEQKRKAQPAFFPVLSAVLESKLCTCKARPLPLLYQGGTSNPPGAVIKHRTTSLALTWHQHSGTHLYSNTQQAEAGMSSVGYIVNLK